MKLVAAERLAELIARGCYGEADPRTLELWARQAGVGYWTLRERCQLAGIPCLAALRFMRVLRAVFLSGHSQTGCDLRDLLDVGDRRSMCRLFSAVGTPGLETRSLTVDEFLDAQTVVRSIAVLESLRTHFDPKGLTKELSKVSASSL